ncbi:hypothetical protein EGR_09237 [Echinococcus granulosus]|uniref:Uncharacterized protein n=1 Tax=Echinococcus granulosus TaxID=6210 RepID=W6U487_ECHGR|nr:hypothetical protein EGR_09237 [Echinococcus granulosus]EUB55923.1 hypothetical protein EGR_09237 [Echinococcus granulosus]
MINCDCRKVEIFVFFIKKRPNISRCHRLLPLLAQHRENKTPTKRFHACIRGAASAVDIRRSLHRASTGYLKHRGKSMEMLPDNTPLDVQLLYKLQSELYDLHDRLQYAENANTSRCFLTEGNVIVTTQLHCSDITAGLACRTDQLVHRPKTGSGTQHSPSRDVFSHSKRHSSPNLDHGGLRIVVNPSEAEGSEDFFTGTSKTLEGSPVSPQKLPPWVMEIHGQTTSDGIPTISGDVSELTLRLQNLQADISRHKDEISKLEDQRRMKGSNHISPPEAGKIRFQH